MEKIDEYFELYLKGEIRLIDIATMYNMTESKMLMEMKRFWKRKELRSRVCDIDEDSYGKMNDPKYIEYLVEKFN